MVNSVFEVVRPFCGMMLLMATTALACIMPSLVRADDKSSRKRVAAIQWTQTNSRSKEISFFPSEIKLAYQGDSQRIGIQVVQADGSTRDVSREVSWDQASGLEIEGSSVTSSSRRAEVGILRGTWRQHAIEIPFELGRSETRRPLSFRNDILPVLTKTGCNSGKCHGAASGKDGFQLSLYGFDPAGDYFRITRQMSGRRVNLASPEICLLIQKAVGEVPHTGGSPIEIGDPNYGKLIRWLADGALADQETTPRPIKIDVFPRRAVLARPSEKQQLIVTVGYSDGSSRDVTDQAVFISNNDATATASKQGLIAATGAGTAFVMARFDQFTSGTEIVVRSGKQYPGLQFQANNYIDELTAALWEDLHILPSEVVSDEVFLRRVYLDVVGLLPTESQRNEFLSDVSPTKRDKLIDELVGSEDFLDLWTMQLAELLQVRRTNGLSRKGLRLYDDWLRGQVHAGVPVNELVRQLIQANGSTFENPATSYYQTETTPQLLAENIAQAFLGTRIQCAQCHNHPFDRWTMDDYYGFAAFVSQVGYKQGKDSREVTVYDLGEGSLQHPVAGRVVKPKFLGGDYADEEALQEDYRAALAEWLADNNDALARNVANILWAHFLGIGIVNPVDDVRVSNPPSNPELLDALGQALIRYKYDVSRLASDICKSKTYQLSTRKTDWNRWDDRNFSRANIRRLRAEVLLDCINQVTATSDDFAGLPLGGRAIEIPDGDSNNYFLETFGRSDRDTPCSCEVSMAPTLSQALHLLNGENTSGKIVRGGRVSRLLTQLRDPGAVSRKLYVMCLGRNPTNEEQAAIEKRLADGGEPTSQLEDLFWALLNSNEFLFNH